MKLPYERHAILGPPTPMSDCVTESDTPSPPLVRKYIMNGPVVFVFL